MDIGELVGVFQGKVASDECDVEEGEYSKKGWKARVNGCGTLVGCSGSRLYKKMKKDHGKAQGYLGGRVPFIEKKKTTKLKDCSPTRFPIQAHHLIPKNFLPDQQVCAFLGKKYSGDKSFELYEDAPYSCDHANNGYCLPYATPLNEWKKARNDEEKLALTHLVMKQTKRQLHQGSHRAGPYEDPPNPTEEDSIHENAPGYLNQIEELLLVVSDEAEVHPIACSKCEPDEENKIPPRQAIVNHMDQVAGITKLLIDARKIYVSKAAHSYWSKKQLKIKIPAWLK